MYGTDRNSGTSMPDWHDRVQPYTYVACANRDEAAAQQGYSPQRNAD